MLIGCGGGNNSTSSSKTITISEDTQIENLGKYNTIKATVDIGNVPKSLYILLSNHSRTQTASPTITHNAKVLHASEDRGLLSRSYTDRPKVLHASAYIQEFNSKVQTTLRRNSDAKYQEKSIAVTPQADNRVGDAHRFYMDNKSGGPTTDATLRKIVSDVDTVFGSKILNIWVSDDSFGAGCNKNKCVTQSMVNALADQFLKSGSDNDIYDWVTNIFGEEWGSAAHNKYSELIAANNEITILLTDIDNDNSANGGTIGYFYSKDNYASARYSGSNERIMFYADAVMFANTAHGDFWQKEIYSTLAHEFQHMIHFYQKATLLDASDDTWVNEMLSEATEDLVATKITHTGPRGIDPNDGSAGSPGNTKGRYPLFNGSNTLSLTSWNNTLADYSKVNAFGTFLTRNYGGAKILHDIMKNKKLHEDAVMYAIHKIPGNESKTFDDILKEWGVAVLLSDHENLQDKPTYNTGDFTPTTYKYSTYELGSINFFNYDPQPYFSNCSTVKAQGNCYYKVGDHLTGTIIIDLGLNGTTEATFIAK